MTEPRPPYRQRLAEYALVLALTSLALPGSALAGPMFHTVYRSYPKQRAGYPGSAAADFNRDGISDVAVTAGTRIQVFLGARGGSLREVWSGTAPRYQGATAAGDVDGDGFVDIVQMSPGQFFATVWHGNGDGTFALSDTLSVPDLPYVDPGQIVLVDVNEDGALDLVVMSQVDNYIWIAPGYGNGTFSPTPRPIGAFGAVFTGLAIADFNGDGHLDCAAVSAQSGLAVFLGRGDGTFLPARFVSLGYSGSSDGPLGLIALDFDGDGHTDLVTTIAKSNSCELWALHNDGSGTFQRVSSVYGDQALRNGPIDTYSILTTADFDGDGRADVVVASPNDGSMFRGNGAAFEPALWFPMPYGEKDLTVVRRGPDQRPMLAATSFAELTTYEWSGGSFDPTPFTPADMIGAAMAVSDFDHDGVADVVTSVTTPTVRDSFAMFRGDGSGRFERMAFAGAGSRVVQIEPVDINRDGLTDLVLLNTPNCGCSAVGNISVLVATSPWSFKPRRTFAVGPAPLAMALGDWNDDGQVDVAVADKVGIGHVSVLAGDGHGGFSPGAGVDLSFMPQSISSADLNEDGRQDLVVAGSPGAAVLLRMGSMAFETHDLGIATEAVNGVVAGDFDRDGHVDLALAYGGNQIVRVFRGRGDGTVDPLPAAEYTGLHGMSAWPTTIQTADVNQDGMTDLLVPGAKETSVLLGGGDGTFEREDYGEYAVMNARVADFNGDGMPDVAFIVRSDWQPVTHGLRVALNSSDATTAILSWLTAAYADRDGVRLSWEAPGFQGAAEVQRRHGSDPWARIGTVTPTSGAIEFLDRDVVDNERYGYRLVLVIQGRSITTDEAWVQVPAGTGDRRAGAQSHARPDRAVVHPGLSNAGASGRARPSGPSSRASRAHGARLRRAPSGAARTARAGDLPATAGSGHLRCAQQDLHHPLDVRTRRAARPGTGISS